jgi:hypothetical protein
MAAALRQCSRGALSQEFFQHGHSTGRSTSTAATAGSPEKDTCVCCEGVLFAQTLSPRRGRRQVKHNAHWLRAAIPTVAHDQQGPLPDGEEGTQRTTVPNPCNPCPRNPRPVEISVRASSLLSADACLAFDNATTAVSGEAWRQRDGGCISCSRHQVSPTVAPSLGRCAMCSPIVGLGDAGLALPSGRCGSPAISTPLIRLPDWP